MNKEKRQLLDKTYQTFMDVGLGQNNLDLLLDIVAKDVVGIGTAIDEKIFGLKELQELFIRQKEQSAGMDLSWKINTLDIHISTDENTAIFTSEVNFHITIETDIIEMYIRFSVVLEYVQNKWIVVHWHGSKPELVESEKDTWGIETWKEKAEALEKEVAERTEDLVEKNRELQIEAALERVRARTMAMRRSDELGQISSLLFKELRSLGLTKFFNCSYVEVDQKNEIQHIWTTNPDGDQLPPDKLPLKGDAILIDRFKAWKEQRPLFHQTVSGNALQKHIDFVSQYFTSAEMSEMVKNYFPDSATFYCANFSQGYLHIITESELTKAEEALFIRFTKVFEQTYTRFLDLQKAEAQSREAEIELALERVRSRTMAMHKSEELAEVAALLFKQLKMLGADLWTAVIAFCKEGDLLVEKWGGQPYHRSDF